MHLLATQIKRGLLNDFQHVLFPKVNIVGQICYSVLGSPLAVNVSPNVRMVRIGQAVLVIG